MKQQNADFLDSQGLGERARGQRRKLDLSQAEMAKRIGSSQPNVSEAERGNPRYTGVAIKIIETAGEYYVDGPYFKVSEA